MSAVTGSERVLALGVDVVLEVVQMAVKEQFPTLMPTLYPGSVATDPKPYASLDAMWKAFSDLAHNKTPTVNGDFFLLSLFLRRCDYSVDLREYRPADRAGGRGVTTGPSRSVGSSSCPTGSDAA